MRLVGVFLLSMVTVVVSSENNIKNDALKKRSLAIWGEIIRITAKVLQKTHETGRDLGWWKRGMNNKDVSLRKIFNFLDDNEDGYIDITELQEDLDTILPGGTMTSEKLMEEADTNGDTKIDFDELTGVATSLPGTDKRNYGRRIFGNRRNDIYY